MPEIISPVELIRFAKCSAFSCMQNAAIRAVQWNSVEPTSKARREKKTRKESRYSLSYVYTFVNLNKTV